MEFVRAIIKNPDGKILMIYNAKFNHWNFPGGKMEGGESPPDAVAREIKEEVNLSLENIALLLTTDVYFKRSDETCRGYFFAADADLADLKLNEPDKVTRAEFLTFDELSRIPNLSESVRAWIRKQNDEPG
jgi:ADP-ribose pyrophosphatase YjhB (NUDIX family)